MAEIGACWFTFENSYLIHAILRKYIFTCKPIYLSLKKYFLLFLVSPGSHKAYFDAHRGVYLTIAPLKPMTALHVFTPS